MKEVWKDIKGFEGRYQVSNLGRVKSLCYHNGTSERILRQRNNLSGNPIVNLYKKGSDKGTLKTVHRLVAEQFIPNENNFPMINHKDENPKNNNVRNLEWCDCSYNVLYSLKRHPERIEKIKEKRKRKNGYKRKNEPYKYKSAVIQKTMNGEEIKIFKNTREVCKEMNFSQSPILECCKGNRKTAYGYKWEFA